MGKQLIALEDHADLLTQGGELFLLPDDLLPVQADPAALDRLQRVDTSEKRALAAAAGTDDDDDLTLVHREAQILKHGIVAISLGQMLKSE